VRSNFPSGRASTSARRTNGLPRCVNLRIPKPTELSHRTKGLAFNDPPVNNISSSAVFTSTSCNRPSPPFWM